MRFVSNPLLPLVLTGLAATLSVQAANLVKPNIKPGLWEVTSNPQISGQMPIPDEDLAKMTPEQRARMEAAMKSAGGQPHVYKDCMTPEKIAHGFDIDRHEDSSCTRKIVSSSANEVTLHDECNKPKRKTVSDVHFEVKGTTAMTGKITVVMTSDSGKSMTVNTTLQGKWLSASCGAIKDSEVEK
jgi:hypothetical protein